MPEKVPVNTIILSRETGKKDAKGEPVMARVSPPVGKPFEFTAEEIEDVMKANPTALRDPVDESKISEKMAEAASEAMQKARALPMGGAAAGDAAQVALTAAKGKKPQKTAGSATEGDAMIAEDDSDTL